MGDMALMNLLLVLGELDLILPVIDGKDDVFLFFVFFLLAAIQPSKL